MIQEYKSFEAEGVIEEFEHNGGVNNRGVQWNNISFVLNAGGREQIRIPMTVPSRHMDKFEGLQNGMEARVTFDLSSRQYEDSEHKKRWNVTCYAWMVTAPGQPKSVEDYAAAVAHTMSYK